MLPRRAYVRLTALRFSSKLEAELDNVERVSHFSLHGSIRYKSRWRTAKKPDQRDSHWNNPLPSSTPAQLESRRNSYIVSDPWCVVPMPNTLVTVE